MDVPMLAGSVLFAATAAYGSVVGIREDVPGEPFRRRWPGRVPTQGCRRDGLRHGGSLAHAGGHARRRRGVPAGSQLPARVCVGMGVAVLVGTLSEPVTWGRRPLSGSVALAIALHLVSGVALVLAGGRRVRTPRTPRS